MYAAYNETPPMAAQDAVVEGTGALDATPKQPCSRFEISLYELYS